MSKSKKKTANRYLHTAVEELAGRYDVTIAFVHMSLRGERSSDRATAIQKDYRAMERAANEAINQVINKNK